MNITLKDAVLFTYEQGLFTVEDEPNYGCFGIYCECHGLFPNGFYSFGFDAENYETKEDFISNHTNEEIAKSIADTIVAFIEDESFPEEACCYLYDMEKFCKEKGELKYLDAIHEWIDKAEKIVTNELENS